MNDNENTADQSGADERAKFEALLNIHSRRRNEHGDYVLPSIQDRWVGWHACALASTQPAPQAAQKTSDDMPIAYMGIGAITGLPIFETKKEHCAEACGPWKNLVEQGRDSFRIALTKIANGEEMNGEFTHIETVAKYQKIARDAIKSAPAAKGNAQDEAKS